MHAFILNAFNVHFSVIFDKKYSVSLNLLRFFSRPLCHWVIDKHSLLLSSYVSSIFQLYNINSFSFCVFCDVWFSMLFSLSYFIAFLWIVFLAVLIRCLLIYLLLWLQRVDYSKRRNYFYSLYRFTDIAISYKDIWQLEVLSQLKLTWFFLYQRKTFFYAH